MPEYTKEDALEFVGSIRVLLGDRVGFKWLVEKLFLLEKYIESVSSENECINAYLDQAKAREDYESYRAGRS